MALYIPVQQTPYFIQGLFSNPKLASFIASGSLDTDTLSAFVSKGDFVNIPQFIQAADFERVDITDTSAASGTRVASVDAKCVVLRDATINTYTKHDEIRAGEDFKSKLAVTAGNKMAKRILGMANRAMKATANLAGHLLDVHGTGTGEITVNAINSARKKLGDQGSELRTALVHSSVWHDLVYDLVNNYKYMGQTSGMIIQDGQLDRLMGIGTWIISDDITPDAGASSSAGDDQYYTHLLCEGALYMGYQETPVNSTFEDSRVPTTLFYDKWMMDYLISPRGVKFTDAANPTDSDFADPSNWATANEDHRNVRFVSIESLGNVKA